MPEPARTTTPDWLAMPIRFSRCGPGSPGKKERGLASPGPLLTPWLVVGVRVTPAEEAPGLVTIDGVPAKGQLMSLPAVAAQAGGRGRQRGCGFPGRHE